MSEKVALRAVPSTRLKNALSESDWLPSSAEIVIGKDILELLSTSMYVDPMTIYREYAQNAADAIDDAREQGLLTLSAAGQVAIAIDPVGRAIRIRDNGTGVPWPQFAQRLSNLGASVKRGTAARGFRGVGRLAGLGYCQELIFRSRSESEEAVSELRWDCRALKSALRSARPGQHLIELLQEIMFLRRLPPSHQPARFFEVELKGVIRHRNDRLLSPTAVGEYLAQVAPVPFSSDFSFGERLRGALRPYISLGALEIRINDSEQPLCRPHRDTIAISEHNSDKVTDLEIRELPGIDGGTAAVVWILHHGYHGALPAKTLIKGIRVRTGNIQVGDHTLLEELFPESRFNGWAIGEVHIIDGKILPNGRRDHFEQSVHFDSLLNQLAPIARDITRRCRDSSIGRKWLREFETHKHAALDKAKAVANGGLSKIAKKGYVDDVVVSIKGMRKVVLTRHISDDMRAELVIQADAVESRITRLLGGAPTASDPLARFKPQVRSAYQQVIELVYECATNSAAANVLVEKILARLAAEPKKSVNVIRSRSSAGSPSKSKRARQRVPKRQ